MKSLSLLLPLSFFIVPVGANPLTNSDGLNVGVANTVPNASKSAAIGSHNSVDEFSFSLGQFNSAYNYGTVFGYENQAHNGSLVGGSRSLTSPDSTISFLYGENNLAFGSFGVTIFGGYNSINQVSPEIATEGWEDYSFIAGTDNEIQQGAGRWGIGNIVLGQYNSISTVSEFFDQNGQNPQSIHGPDGSGIAAQYPIRSYLLGHDLPALSNPAGSNDVSFDNDPPKLGMNTDMPDKLKSGNWGDWKHSDLKNQKMDRVWKLYSDMVSKGKLNDKLIPPPID